MTDDPTGIQKTALQTAASLAKDVYTDGLRPSVLAISEGFVGIIKAITYYPRYWSAMSDISINHKIGKFQSSLEQKIDSIPEERRILPKPNIVGPVVQALEYAIIEDEISEMFANLLASASDIETAHLVHPAFIEIIKQLHPFEAILISDYSEDWINGEFPESLPLYKFRIKNAIIDPVNLVTRSHKLSDSWYFTFDDFNYSITEEYSYQGYRHIRDLPNNNIISSIENLLRLGIIKFEADFYETVGVNSTGIFLKPVESLVKALGSSGGSTNELSLEFEVAYITRLGREFIQTCLPSIQGE